MALADLIRADELADASRGKVPPREVFGRAAHGLVRASSWARKVHRNSTPAGQRCARAGGFV